MQYFGVPVCPYCKKRVNLIRTWSLKRQGEYKCPRCQGISNIYLSPLIYVFAVIAIFASGAIFFFHHYILDDTNLSTVLQVFIPFALFFLISLFQVYLEKPVIKRVSREELEGKKKKKKRNVPADIPVNTGRYLEQDQYQPSGEYATGETSYGPPSSKGRTSVPETTSVVPLPQPYRAPAARRPAPASSVSDATTTVPSVNSRQAASPRPASAAPRTAAPRQARPASAQTASRQSRPAAAPVRQQPVSRPVSTAVSDHTAVYEPVSTAQPRPTRERTAPTAPAQQVSRQRQADAAPVTHVDIPTNGDDFFAKYNDPDYVQRRLAELRRERGE